MDIQDLIRKNILTNIDNYSSKLSISKVIKFFERHEIFFTKTMIQNYVRVGLIPMPADKRYYQKKHLVILLLVYDLKNIFSLDELKSMFEIFYSDDDFDYLYFVDCFNESFNDAVNNEMNVLKPLENTKSSKLEALLKLSARASALKYIVQEKL